MNPIKFFFQMIKDCVNPRCSSGVDNLPTVKKSKVILTDTEGLPLISITHNEKEIEISFHRPVTLKTTGEFNWVNDGDILIDSHNGVIHLNSRLAKPIRDLPSSIAYREEQAKKQKELEGYQPEIIPELNNPIPPIEE